MPKRIKYTPELLLPLVQESKSIAQVARRLGVSPCGGCHTYLSKVIKRFGIDTSHFVGQGWSRGLASSRRKNADEVLIAGCNEREDTFRLRRAMLEKGRVMRCDRCGLGPEWCQEPLVLEIDHVNNDWGDNRLENLRFLCPNCHTQKTTTDSSKAKFVQQLKSSVLVLPAEPPKCERENSNERQLCLKLHNWGPKKVRQSPGDIDWRKLPRPTKRKVERPSKEDLERMVWEKPMRQIANDFGLTDNSIRKWCKKYGITNLPPSQYWTKRHAGWSHEKALGLV